VTKRAQKEATDIEFLASTLDRRGLIDQLPLYVTDNTDSTPTLKLEDGELRYFLTKIDKLEDTMLCLQETVNKMHAMISRLMSEFDKVEKEAVGCTSLRPVPADPPVSQPNEVAGKSSNFVNWQSPASVSHIPRDITTATTYHSSQLRVSHGVSESGTTSSVTESCDDLDSAAVADDGEDDYTLIESNRKNDAETDQSCCSRHIMIIMITQNERRPILELATDQRPLWLLLLWLPTAMYANLSKPRHTPQL